MRVLISILFSFLIVGCATDGVYVSPAEVDELRSRIREANAARGVYNFIRLYENEREIEFSYGSPETVRMSIDEFEGVVTQLLSGYTIVTRGTAHGTQLEYYSPDGRIALWYPGNSNAVLGTFRTRKSFEPFNMWGNIAGVQICFSYSPNSYNPVTGAQGAAEQCTSAYAHIASILGKHEGDVFGLLNGEVPHVLDRDEVPNWPNGQSVIPERAPHNLDGIWP